MKPDTGEIAHAEQGLRQLMEASVRDAYHWVAAAHFRSKLIFRSCGFSAILRKLCRTTCNSLESSSADGVGFNLTVFTSGRRSNAAPAARAASISHSESPMAITCATPVSFSASNLFTISMKACSFHLVASPSYRASPLLALIGTIVTFRSAETSSGSHRAALSSTQPSIALVTMNTWPISSASRSSSTATFWILESCHEISDDT
mmetsp:Transcript_63478/g.183995  ORF Transcript_63478/g.183995 Transcript_63478/m.183995 type:complete len:205 (-) Transcript_63478:429-1043(-)